jgi:hypothetical protein
VPRNAARKPSCEDCYFGRNLLCALPNPTPCATFRPDHPEGLRPPQQLRFVFRNERRARAAWAFPTAAEQAALHAWSGGGEESRVSRRHEPALAGAVA